MKHINEVKLSFPSCSANESFARVAVSGFFAQLDPPVDELADVKTAVSEAVTNCIVHGYRAGVGTISMLLRITESGEALIRISDRGCGIPDIVQAMQPLYTTAPEEERSGLGFTVMQSFMDAVRVRSTPGRGTTVTMRKKFRSRRQDG